ncbi:T9SS type A sorting domain-containing protein [Cytophaga sp.]|uniref:T9SS type A sorting domain-containing protein n=1 Tax=Cytophaga sp. TaxID=29535 RepID=UPI003F817EE7
MAIYSPTTKSITEYTDPEIDLTDNAIPYDVTKIEFTWSDFDQSDMPPNTSLTLNLWFNDGSSKILINTTSYFFNSSNSNYSSSLSTGGNFIASGSKEYTYTATYFDKDNNEQTIAESDPWTITIITPPNQILNNKICCNQNTFAFPFDPASINQDNGSTITTEDGALITSVQWQKLNGSTWANITGATQYSYDPPSINGNTQYRRVLTSSSGAINNSAPVAITKITERISGNSICCSQTTTVMPFDPAIITQKINTTVSSNVGPSVTFTYQWQDSTKGAWSNIVGATNSFYDPSWIKNSTAYRRIVFASTGSQNISNSINVFLQPCDRPVAQQNVICGDQTFYKLQHGEVINPAKILGAFISTNIDRREFGYDYLISYDGKNWSNVKAKHLLTTKFYTSGLAENTYYICKDVHIKNATDELCAIVKNELDYQMPPYIFDINKGALQHIYIKRDYYHWYDEFNCGLFNTFSCGAQWHFQSSSNIATITLTTGDFPKPVEPITSSRDNVTCNWADQTINFSVPQLNNSEYYKWEIPATWSSYTALEGPYANQISVNTNNAEKNVALGGQVCLTVTQGGQSDRQCKTITGVPQFYSILPTAPVSACEGQTVVIKPVLVGTDTNPDHYTYNWAAYQSPVQSCNNPAGTVGNTCKELKITIANVRQSPNQEVTLTTTNAFGCTYTSKAKLVATPGLQMGILNSYNDPTAISTSGLAVNTTANYLYFTSNNKTIYRSYYDNTQSIWKYAALSDKTTSKAIVSDGPVAYYKGSTDKLFYAYTNGSTANLFYAESADNGLTWVDYFTTKTVATNIDPRIKIYGNNVYYIDIPTRQVLTKDVTATNSLSIIVGNSKVNYSQRMFTVEDGILAYADISNNIVAYNAVSGVAYTINVPATIKQVNYNSSISVYNKNIYYTSSTGALRILKFNAATGVYDNYEEVPNLQLAGSFAINKQTGTLYAKAYDVLGKQIYYKDNNWKAVPIDNYLSYSAVQSEMTYANGHAYYIGDNGYLSNTYYIAPCVPEVLRTANDVDLAGDIMNDPLSNTIAEDRSVLLYPNPANHLVKATFTVPQESLVEISVVPITGGSKDLKYRAITASGTQDVSFDMSTYAAGIYIVEVHVNGTLYTKSKLIKY